MRKDDAEKKTAVPSAVARAINPRGRGAPMVAIGDVKRGNSRELSPNKLNFRSLRDHPGRVPNAVAGGEVNLRRLGRPSVHQLIDFRPGAIDQEHRAGLRVERLDVPDAIVLLVRPCQLVLLDDTLQIVFATGHRHQSYLVVLAHDLAIKIETGLRVL